MAVFATTGSISSRESFGGGLILPVLCTPPRSRFFTLSVVALQAVNGTLWSLLDPYGMVEHQVLIAGGVQCM